ncbi:unnamed protein product [Meganyctiphanes norvegica]|uniref:Uncharacterized protein n=1 Tax=Meganyctiphanes norvegica TaxID=48144 RepID=A0AAV2Q706_MEGNR
MGNKNSAFTEEELQDYEELTYLTKKEVLMAWRRWNGLNKNIEPANAKRARIPAHTFQDIPELKYNPFKIRMTQVFSSEHDNQIGFEDFLDVLSVMSDKAPIHLKAHYLFRLFDETDDNILDKYDLAQLVEKVTGEEHLEDQEKERVVKKVLIVFIIFEVFLFRSNRILKLFL